MVLLKISAPLVCALWLLMVCSCHCNDQDIIADPSRKNLSDMPPENNQKTLDDTTLHHKSPDNKSSEDKSSDDKSSDDKSSDHKSSEHKTQHHHKKKSHKSSDKSEHEETPKQPKDSSAPEVVPIPVGIPQNPTQNAPQTPSNRGPQYPPQDWVDAHNAIRKPEGVVLMTWNESLADYAWNYVQKIAPDCKPEHSQGPWGECLFQGDGNATAKEIVDYWASEKQYWDPKTKKCQDGQDCGHYLQVVNPNSPALGCAKMKCGNDPWYHFDICNYIW